MVCRNMFQEHFSVASMFVSALDVFKVICLLSTMVTHHWTIISGQIIATSPDLMTKGGLVREIPLFQGNLGWWNIVIWPDYLGEYVLTFSEHFEQI